MRIKSAILLIALLCAPVAFAFECQRKIAQESVPCNITTTWQYPTPCNTNRIIILNETGMIQNASLYDYDILCQYTFNISSIGSYEFKIMASSGIVQDTGNITVGDESMLAVFILGAVVSIIFIVLGFWFHGGIIGLIGSLGMLILSFQIYSYIFYFGIFLSVVSAILMLMFLLIYILNGEL